MNGGTQKRVLRWLLVLFGGGLSLDFRQPAFDLLQVRLILSSLLLVLLAHGVELSL
jgi:hypothetical protein